MENKVLKLGFFGRGGKLKMENGFLSYEHANGQKAFRLAMKDMETVVVANDGIGQSRLKIISHRAHELAVVDMPLSWANECQAWILKNR